MRARAHTEPVTVTPVAKVVPAALAGTGPVRDRVVAEALMAQECFGQLVQPRNPVIIGLRGRDTTAPALDRLPPRARPVRDRFLRLERELERVAREVIGGQADCGGEILLPGPVRLTGPAEDEVQVDVEADRARRRHRGSDVRRLVRAAQGAEADRREGLGAERQARDPERCPGLEPGAGERRRIRRDGRFGGTNIERAAQGGAEFSDLIRLQKAWGTAAKEERCGARSAKSLALAPDLTVERVEVARPKRTASRRRREVAVGTASRAKRDVNVKTKSCARFRFRSQLPHLRIDPRRSGSSASALSSAVFARSTSHSRDSLTNARRCEGRHSASVTTRSSPKSGSNST